MAQRQLGKLCLSITSKRLLKTNINLKDVCRDQLKSMGKDVDFYESKGYYENAWRKFLHGPKSKLEKGDDLYFKKRLMIYESMFAPIEQDASALKLAGENMLEAEKTVSLRDDVLPFLESLKTSSWPFAESVIYLLTPTVWHLKRLKDLGIPINMDDSVDTSSPVQIRGMAGTTAPDLLDERVGPFSRIRESLSSQRSDHRDFRHIHVASSIIGASGVLAAKQSGFGGVHHILPESEWGSRVAEEVRERLTFPESDLCVERTRNLKAQKKKFSHLNLTTRNIYVENVPTIKNLSALSQWKEEYFDCVKVVTKDGETVQI